ncbi:unnamed protein product [Tilletia controversa]|nr:unnamed protein product [Tilletia controversa]
MEEIYLSGEEDIDVVNDDSDIDEPVDTLRDLVAVPSSLRSIAAARAKTRPRARPQHHKNNNNNEDEEEDDDLDDAYLAALDEEAHSERVNSDRLKLLGLLPWAVESLEQMDSLLDSAVKRFFQALYIKDKEAGMMLWHERIVWLLNNRYPLKPSTHIRLVKAYYYVATLPTAPGAEAISTEMCRVCIFLLSSYNLKAEHLTLPWRPLYDRYYREIYPSARRRECLGEGANAALKAHYLELATLAQRFFAREGKEGEGVVEEMMGVILPKLDGTDELWTLLAYQLASAFLPRRLAYKWFQPMFRLSQTITSVTVRRSWMRLLGAISLLYGKDHIKDPLPVKEEQGERNVGFFTESHFQIIMNRTLREITPAGAGADANADESGLSLVAESKDDLACLAHIITYSLAADRPDGSSTALLYFNRFLTAVESKFHPLYGGVGQLQLSCLTYTLLGGLVNRVYAESRPECTIPQHKRLTEDIVDQITERLNGLVLMSLFSKQTEAAEACQGSLLKIAVLRPALAIPPLLERSYQSLQALETSERTQPIMKCLALLATPILRRSHYKEGAQHLLPLLHLCLPGIDPNDAFKTINTGLLIAMLVHCVRIEDLTRADVAQQSSSPVSPMAERGGMLLDGGAAAVPESESDSREDGSGGGDELDEAIRISTEGADDWVVQFFRRTLSVFASLAEEGAKGQSAWETEVQAATSLISAASYLCQSLSPRLFDLALDVVVDFVGSTPSTNCHKQIGQLVFAFARVDNERVMGKLLPICDQRIRYELGAGAGSSISTSTTSTPVGDTSLNWYLSVLGGLVGSAGVGLVGRHQESLMALLVHAADGCKAARSYYLLSRILVKALLSLMTVYPSEERFVGPEEWASSDFQRDSFRRWGAVYEPGQVEVNWHVPGREEVQFALELVQRFGMGSLAEVEQLLQVPAGQRGTLWSNTFCRKLTLARAVFTGIPSLIELPNVFDGEQLSDMDTECLDFYRAWTPIKAHFVLQDPSDERYQRVLQFRQQFARTVVEAAGTLQQTGGYEHLDDSRVVLKCISSALLHYAFTDELHSPTAYCDTYVLVSCKLEEKQKAYPRIWWIRMAHRFHKYRQRLRAVRRRRTALDDALLRELMRFTQSEYRSIRIRSQSVVESVSSNFSGYRTMSMPMIIDALQLSAPKHRTKGAIHLLSGDGFAGWLVFHCKFLPVVWDALMALQDHSDHKVQELASGSAEVIFGTCGADNISFLNIKMAHLPKMVTRAMDENPEDRELLVRVQADVHRRAAVQSDVFAKLRRAALQVLDDKRVHWTFAEAALLLLGLLDRVYDHVEPEIITRMAHFSTDPSPEMRSLSNELFGRLLYYIKIRTLAPSKDVLAEYRKKQPLSRSERLQRPVSKEWQATRQASFRGELKEDARLDETALQDAWLLPDEKMVYFKLRTGPPVEWEEASRPALDALRETVTSLEWWSAWISRNAEEKEKTSMVQAQITLSKGLIEIFGPAIVKPLTSAVEEVIKEDPSDRANHRAAAEAVVGLMRGIKNWTLDEQRLVHAWFSSFAAPLFKTLSSECADIWKTSLTMILGNRDPRRNQFLIDFILEQLKGDQATWDDQSAWEQSKAYWMLGSLLYALGGKSFAWLPDLSEAILPKMQSDYVAVTQIVGRSLAVVDLALCAPKFSGVEEFLQKSEVGFGTLIQAKDHFRAQMQTMFARLEELLPHRTPPAQGRMSKADRLAFSIFSWAGKILENHLDTDFSDVLLEFAPQLKKIHELRDNRQLSGTAVGMIWRALQPINLTIGPDERFDRMVKLYTSTDSYQTRMAILGMLNAAFLMQAFVCTPQTAERVLETTVQALQDDHVDVRAIAAKELTWLVMQYHRDNIPSLIKLFVQQTQETVLPHKSDPGYGEALKKLHGALLGAGALVLAFPTSVPDWMGKLITSTLAHHDEDPAPIGPSVRRVATSFKETHEMHREGAWDEHATHFTPEELEVVSDWTLGRAADYIA